MPFPVSSPVVTIWTVLDLSSNPLTGVTTPAGITFALHRQSGSVAVAATEPITWTEIGVTGTYSIVFTPVNAGQYKMELKELHVSSQQRVYPFFYEVVTAGSAFSPTFANAFCAETDIERWIQQPITASTQPSSNEAAGFAETRAAAHMSLCHRLGFTVTPSTVVAGSRIEDLLREANAVGAALDYTIAQCFRAGASKTERIESLMELWTGFF